MVTQTGIGVVDRIVDGTTAVLLLEDDGKTTDQFDIPVETLPDAGQHEGALFKVEVADGEIADLAYQPERERERRERIEEKFDRLSKRLGEDSEE